MTTQYRLTLAAALAVALACAALEPVYVDLGWLVPALGAVLAVSGATTLARLVRLPRVLHPLTGLLGLAGWVSVAFAAQTLAFGLLPGPETVEKLRTLISDGLVGVDELAAPVPTTSGLVLVGVLGVGAITVLVDTIAVTLRKAAVSGLPLLLLFAVPSAVLPGGLGFLPFVLGAAGWMGLLLADSGDRAARWGTPLSSRALGEDASLGQVGRRIGVAALGMAVIVPALVPGLDSRVLASGSGTGFGGSRTTTTYNPILRLSGQLRLPEPRPLFSYASDDPTPQYVRLTTLDEFSATDGWSSSQLTGDIEKDRVEQGLPTPSGLGPADTGRTVDVTVTLSDQLDGPWLPVTFPPASIDIPGPWIWDAEAETAFSTRRRVAEVDQPYTIRTRVVEPSVELLRADQTVPADIARTYAAPVALAPSVAATLARVTAGATTDYDRAVALQDFFQGPTFRYDTTATAPNLNTPDALQNFLEQRTGYCEQYASAMAAMVRALGVPARVAVGFTAGTVSGSGRRITTSDAHAWPEVWFAGAGWVRFEPTPRSDQQLSIPSYTRPPAEPTGPTASAAPTAAASAPAVGPSAATDSQDRAGQDGAQAAGGGTGRGGRQALSVLVMLAVLALLAAPMALAALRRRRRLGSGSPDAIWAVVRDDAVDVGHRWRPMDSPRAAAVQLRSAFGLDEAAAQALGRVALAVERFRYARPAGVAEGAPDLTGTQVRETAALRQDAASVRAGLLATRRRQDRLRARVLPPSTLAWAAHRSGTLVADLLDRADGLPAAAGRRLRRPRSAAG